MVEKLLIDGDILIYRSCSAVEKDVHFDDVHILQSKFSDAIAAFTDQLHDLFEQAETEECVIAISDTKNWRKDFIGSYKANRKDVRKPLVFSRLRDYVLDKFDCVVMPRLEADDVLGILSTKNPDGSIIWSTDKDLMQIPGKHLIDDEIVTVSPESGEKFWMYQTLVGDVSDNYKGAKGVGPKTADKILSDPSWEVVKAAFKGDDEGYITNKTLSRILQNGDYNENTGEVNIERWFD